MSGTQSKAKVSVPSIVHYSFYSAPKSGEEVQAQGMFNDIVSSSSVLPVLLSTVTSACSIMIDTFWALDKSSEVLVASTLVLQKT